MFTFLYTYRMQHNLTAAQHRTMQRIHAHIADLGQVFAVAEQNRCLGQRPTEIVEPHVVVHAAHQVKRSDGQEGRLDF